MVCLVYLLLVLGVHGNEEETWIPSLASQETEKWAWNKTVMMRRHGAGIVGACLGPREFVTTKGPLRVQKPALGMKRIAWFMSIAKPDDKVSQSYADFAKAATTSARLNAPSLAPYFVYTYLPSQDLEKSKEDDLERWLRSVGTRVVRWQLSFWDKIPKKIRTSKQGHLNVGAFGRLDVPLIVGTVLREEFEARSLSHEYVLYTDADVMFALDWPQAAFKCRDCARGWPHPKCCRHPLSQNMPEIFLAGTEVFAIWGLNSGIMLMNVRNMLKDREPMIHFANAKAWNFMSYDQGLLENFYRRPPHSIKSETTSPVADTLQDQTLSSVSQLNISLTEFKAKGNRLWDSFDDNLYNARGFMKFNKGQLHAHPPVVWHWHGFKPYDVQCWLKQLQDGVWHLKDDIRSLIQHSKRRGCRGLINHRMVFPECSLHLYLLLYASYQRLIAIADTMLPAFMRENFPDDLKVSLDEEHSYPLVAAAAVPVLKVASAAVFKEASPPEAAAPSVSASDVI